MSVHLLNIIHWLEQHPLPCLFKQVTHFDCPGCGLQRSLILLLKGDLPASFGMYPALIPILLLFVLLLCQLLFKMRHGGVALKYSYILCAGIILLSYIYKIVITKTPFLS